MKNICLYFQVHHPFSLQTFRFFDIGGSKPYYNYELIEKEIQEAATNYYIPANEYLLKLIQYFKGNLKLSFNISTTALDQFLIYSPKLITSFRQLAETGYVEFTGNVMSHSIVSLSGEEQTFLASIKQSRQRMEYYFGQRPSVFVNTDLLFTNQIAKCADKAEYPAILTTGINRILQWRSPNYLYSTENHTPLKILFRNEKLSNDLSAFLNLETLNLQELIDAINIIPPEEPITNIYLNYNTLGGVSWQKKHQLFGQFVSKITQNKTLRFDLPSGIISRFGGVSEIGTNEPICWVNQFHPSYYPGNELQREAIRQLYKLAGKIESTKNASLKTDWHYLQTSDHFHLMDHNHPDYQKVNTGTRIYKSKYDAFINYMNILTDFRTRLKKEAKVKKRTITSFVSTKSHSVDEFK